MQNKHMKHETCLIMHQDTPITKEVGGPAKDKVEAYLEDDVSNQGVDTYTL
jgi:hypothetical protein